MKVSLNTIRQYIDFELPSVDELVSRINQQLGQVEEVIDLSDKYKDVVVVKVLGAEKHPNADRLSVCVVDDGGVVKDVERDSDGHVQVVCGAPNVHGGMFAAWLPPNSTVPASYEDKEPFVLETREIRGVKSNGMLAAADELALGSDHEGIIEIHPDEWKPTDIEIKPGASFAEAYGLNDTILDIENKMFTHRPDCFGQLGVAREISGILGHKFTSPDWYIKAPEFAGAEGLKLNVFNEAGEKVPRFMVVALKNVEVKPSPLWLQIELVRLGSKPISNIVDITNYVMLLTAQPTHAYDYDKLRGATLGVRMAKPGEKATLLNDKSYELTGDDIVIVDGEGIVGLGGVMGGGNSEVSSDTKNVVLEVATFDMYAIRKTSMRYGLFTDAVTRFNKGQSPLQNDRIIQLLMTSIADVLPGVEQASDVVDRKINMLWDTSMVGLSRRFVQDRLGGMPNDSEIVNLLENVEFEVNDAGNGAAEYPATRFNDDGTITAGNNSEVVYGADLSVKPPFWRTDIELPEDIVEEVGRLYGFDKLPVELPHRSITPAAKNPVFEVKKRIREQLRRAGANEVLTYSFVHEDILKKAGQDPSQAYQLGNALSPDLQYYRLSLTPSLLEKVHPNIKSGHDEFALFELGKAHVVGKLDDEDLPKEFARLSLVYASKSGKKGAAYFVAKAYLTNLLESIGVKVGDVTFAPLEADDADSANAYYEPKRAAKVLVGDVMFGRIGEYKSSVTRNFKLPSYCAGFEIGLEPLMAAEKTRAYTPLSRFPKVTQDISLKVASDVSYESLFTIAKQAVNENQPGECEYSLTPLSIYQPEGDSSHKTITLRLTIASYERTLTDKDVTAIMDAVAETTKQLKAERV